MNALILLALALPLAAVPAAAAAPRADYYVATDGSDAWSGKRPAPNARRTDGPFATLDRARQAVRQHPRGDTGRPVPIVVMVRGGTYWLKQPLLLTPDDSGDAAHPVVYAAYPGERPVVSGGRRLTGWQVDARTWRIGLPEVARGEWTFSQLWVNGERRYRPRLPRDGYYLLAGDSTSSPAAQGKGFDQVRVKPGEVRADWQNLPDVELLAFQTWTMARMRIASFDPATNKVTFAGHTASTQWWSALPKGNRYLVENVREALGAPGDWYLDRKAGDLLYVPRPGEDPNRAEVVAPVLDHLVELRGDPAAKRFVSNVTFRGLTFAHTNWNCPSGGNSFAQAEVHLGAAIRATGARDCALEECRVTHTGEYAVELGAGCKRNRVAGCELTDMAAGGVKIGTQGLSDDDEQVASHNTVENCLIAHSGRMHPAAVGVWIGQSHHNTIAHNEIADLYYTGISVGWTWGYGPSLAHHNVLEYNHVHHLGQGVLSDMGATYTLGISPGSVQRNNVFHDVVSFAYGGWGIYFDEGTTGMVAENNLVYRCKSANFHQHYGRENVCRNNIWALGVEDQLMRTRAEEHLSFTFDRNIIYWDSGALLGSNWSGDNYKLDNNLYWRADGKPFDFAGQTLEQWRARGQDVHSVVADPLFVNPAKNDFRLRPGSPAAKIGFVPFDTSTVGRLKDGRALKPTALAPRAFPAPPPPPGPQPIAEDFEDCDVGQQAPGATTYAENDRYTIRVTDETAAGGKRSLKFTDGPGQQNEYNPHLFWTPGFTEGALVDEFDIRLGARAFAYHEWRDTASPYHAGPSVWMHPDGTLRVGGKVLAELPRDRWIHFRIECGLGSKATGKWSLQVQMPGRTAPLRWTDLPCDPAFKELRWYGFTANGTEDAVFYLDNVKLAPGR